MAESRNPEPVSTAETIESLRRRNTELAAANAALTEAVAARDAFLIVAGHELRNPMTPIVGRVQLLRRLMRKPDSQPEKIEQGLAQIDWLIDRYMKRATTLLDVARITTGRYQLDLAATDLCRLVREVVEGLSPLADHASIQLDVGLPDDSKCRWICDRLAVEQILDNLLSNAIKYGAGKPVMVAVLPRADQIVLRVTDNGPGISPEDQARIFERFERAIHQGDQAVGFGIGLWVVRQLAEAMDGKVEVASMPGQGATFTVSLPLKPTKDPA